LKLNVFIGKIKMVEEKFADRSIKDDLLKFWNVLVQKRDVSTTI